MPRRWLPLLCAVVLVSGCGSSSSSDEPSSKATPTVHSRELQRIPQAVFDDAEALWHREFANGGLTYRPARLTIFSQQVHTACGTHGSQTGPFYCPASFRRLPRSDVLRGALEEGRRASRRRRAGVRGRPRVAHHVQTLLGLMHHKALADQQDPARANARSVRFELQADCLAGVWMHSVYRRGELTEADLVDALNAAAVVGDDFLKNVTGQGRPPEDWTHGSSAQRQHRLKTGFDEGRPEACDTFNQ